MRLRNNDVAKMTLLLFILVFISPATFAAAPTWPEVSCQQTKVPLFQSSQTIEIELKGTFPVSEDKTPAEIKYRSADSEAIIPVDVAQRGKSRLSCPFRPVRIFWGENRDVNVQGTIFEHVKGQDMKLTTHCRYDQGTIAEHTEDNEVILKEYVVYKILKAFDLPTFDVRLAKLRYTDASDRLTTEGYGFFIESDAQLAKRCDLEHVKSEDVVAAVQAMDKQIYIPYLYSRLISDARDFMVEYEGGHNSEPFWTLEKITKLVVPYDFNDSGLVNSGIAGPWTFTPTTAAWFNLMRAAPFTRDSDRIPLADDLEMTAWKNNMVSMAELLLPRKSAVLKVIDESPLQEESKELFRAHIEMLMGQFEKIIADGATPDPNIPDPLL